MALGGGVVTAVLAGLGAIAFAYEHLTDASQKAIDKAEKLREKYAELARIRMLGFGGEFLKDIEDFDKGTKALEQRVGFLKTLRGALSLTAAAPLMNWLVGRDSTSITGNVSGRQSALNEYGVRLGEENQRKTDEANRKAEEALNKATADRLARERERGAETAIQNDAANRHRDDITAARKLNLVPETAIPGIQFVGLLSDAELKHAESVRKLDEEYKAAKEVFSSTSSAVENFKEGVKQAATGLLNTFSPSNIVQGLAGGLIQKVDGLISNILGGITGGVRHALFGDNSEERAAKRAEIQATKAVAFQLDAIAASLAHNDLQSALDQLRIGLIATLSSIDAAEPGKRNETQRNQDRQRAIDLEKQSEAQARHQDELNRRYAQEDLGVRNLRAQGRTEEADLLAFRERQAREMQAALDSNKDETYRNTLAMVQNNELIAFLNGTLQDAVRNAPSGFFANAYYSDFADRRSSPADPFGTGMVPPNYPGGGSRNAPGSPEGRVNLTFSGDININGNRSGPEMAKEFVSSLKQLGNSVIGNNVPLSRVLDRLGA